MRQTISRSWSRHRVGLTCALALLLAAGLAGCDSSVSPQFAAKDTAPATVPAGEPTATSTLLIETPDIEVPTSTVGWQTYTDSTYHFKTVIPPGWRLGTVLDTDALGSGDCEYDVIYFPPGSTHIVEPRAWVGMLQSMRIVVYLQCSAYDPAQNPYLSGAH